MARQYRFFLRNTAASGAVENFLLTEKDEPEIFFQLMKVLRVKPGDKITFGGAQEHEFEVTNVTKKGVEMIARGSHKNENELSFSLELWLCLPNKPEKLEFILQKAVEIGVSKVTLLEADFSQFKHQPKMQRLGKIMVEAAEQSERAVVPKLTVAGKLTDALKNPPENLWVALERSQGKFSAAARDIQILIGPEGGFSDQEKALFKNTFSLGKRVLRMETAAIISLGLASAFDLQGDA